MDEAARPVQQVIARSAHRIPGRAPLRLAVGDRVEAGERSEEWPEFVFVTAPHGSGWVPARYLSRPSGPAVAETAYDTTELPTTPGEVLDVVEDDAVSGWLWCRSASGRAGWVPRSSVEPRS